MCSGTEVPKQRSIAALKHSSTQALKHPSTEALKHPSTEEHRGATTPADMTGDAHRIIFAGVASIGKNLRQELLSAVAALVT